MYIQNYVRDHRYKLISTIHIDANKEQEITTEFKSNNVIKNEVIKWRIIATIKYESGNALTHYPVFFTKSTYQKNKWSVTISGRYLHDISVNHTKNNQIIEQVKRLLIREGFDIAEEN